MTYDEQIAVIQAAKEGKLIERWGYDCDPKVAQRFCNPALNHAFDFAHFTYRVKREPHVFWEVRYDDREPLDCKTKEAALSYAKSTGGTAYRCEEVVE